MKDLQKMQILFSEMNFDIGFVFGSIQSHQDEITRIINRFQRKYRELPPMKVRLDSKEKA